MEADAAEINLSADESHDLQVRVVSTADESCKARAREQAAALAGFMSR
jgi:hypothetical protein